MHKSENAEIKAHPNFALNQTLKSQHIKSILKRKTIKAEHKVRSLRRSSNKEREFHWFTRVWI